MTDVMGGACGANGTDDKAYNILILKPEVTNPLGRPERR
jgi:hypothetical protein